MGEEPADPDVGKGVGMTTMIEQKLFAWQQAAMDKYFEANAKDFLVHCVPGGGKTIFGLRVAQQLVIDGAIDLVIVVAPTLNIKAQWKEVAAKQFGLTLLDDEATDEGHGLVCTYQQVAFNPEEFANTCGSGRVMVIFDEVHHAGEREGGKSWGDTAGLAFQFSERRLSLTGTPFRSDDYKIAFVRYVDGVCVPDFSYSYQEALEAGVCRHVEFPIFAGSASWVVDDKIKEIEIGKKCSKSDTPKILKTILDADGGFARSMVVHANASLEEMPDDSAGLILANDCAHARKLAKLVEEVTGHKPVLATTQDGGVSKIKKFKDSPDRWIVAVRQVSEGVDIPRIRVVCYMTKYRTELFFVQAVGRLLRRHRTDRGHSSLFYIPGIKELRRLAESCFDGKTHRIEDKTPSDCFQEQREWSSPSELEAIASSGFMVGTIIPQRVKLAAHKQSSEEAKARKLQAKKRRYQNPEVKAKIIEAQRLYLKKRYQDPETRKFIIEAVKKRQQDPEVKAKRREAQKRRQQDPEIKAKNIEAARRRYQNPEYKAKLLEKQRNRYQDPEIRAKKLESKRKRRAAAKLAKEAAKNEQP